MEPTTLTTGRLRLRPLEPADAEAVHAACQDPAIQRWTTVPVPYEREHARAWVEEIAPRSWREDSEYGFAVCPAGSDRLVAAVGVRRLHPARYEIGYWTAPEARGRGYTTEAVAAVARWVFTELGAGRLQWQAEVGNTGSRAVAEKAGFQVEGVLRAGLQKNGTWRDCWVGSLLPSDLGLAPQLPYLPAR